MLSDIRSDQTLWPVQETYPDPQIVFKELKSLNVDNSNPNDIKFTKKDWRPVSTSCCISIVCKKSVRASAVGDCFQMFFHLSICLTFLPLNLDGNQSCGLRKPSNTTRSLRSRRLQGCKVSLFERRQMFVSNFVSVGRCWQYVNTILRYWYLTNSVHLRERIPVNYSDQLINSNIWVVERSEFLPDQIDTPMDYDYFESLNLALCVIDGYQSALTIGQSLIWSPGFS